MNKKLTTALMTILMILLVSCVVVGLMNARFIVTDDSNPFSADIYARFIATFDPNGGEIVLDGPDAATASTISKTVTVGSAYGKLPQAQKKGYRLNGWSTKAVVLPEGMVQLEYLETNNGAAINTGYKVEDGNFFGYEIDVEPKYGADTTIECGCGNEGAWSGQRYNNVYYILGSNFELGAKLRRQAGVREQFKADVREHSITLSRTVNGNTEVQIKENWSGSCTTERPWYIFAYSFNSDSASRTFRGKIYSHRIFSKGELVREFIPAKNTVTEECGMYETLTGEFFTTANGGTFTGKELKYDIIASDSNVTIAKDHTLYAVWEPQSYTVKLNANDVPENPAAGNVPGGEIQVRYYTSFNKLPLLTRDGFKFDGWFDKNGNEYKNGDKVLLTEDTELFARWTALPCTIMLNLAGGSLEDTQNWINRGDAYFIKTATAGEAEELPIPEKRGYRFKGWTVNTLPEEYTPLKYIESTTSGKQWIDTGYVLTSEKVSYELVFAQSGPPGYQGLFGAETNGAPYTGIPYSNTATLYMGNGSVGCSFNLSKSDEVNEYYAEADGEGNVFATYKGKREVGRVGGTIRSENSIGVMNDNGMSGRNAAIRAYSFRISDNGKLVRDLVPCTNSQNEAGMYDYIEGTFYPKAMGSTTEFITGSTNLKQTAYINGDGNAVAWVNTGLTAVWEPIEYTIIYHDNISPNEIYADDDVELPDEYQRVEYIESSGNRYIDSGISISETDRLEIKTKYIAYDIASKSVWGNQPDDYKRSFGLYMRDNFMYLFAGSNNAGVSTCKLEITKNTPYTVDGLIDCSERVIKATVNDAPLHDYNYTGDISNGNISIFDNKGQNNQQLSGRIYYFTMIKNGETVRNLIPCYYKKHYTVGMYDTVSGEFYSGEGTSKFVAGPTSGLTEKSEAIRYDDTYSIEDIMFSNLNHDFFVWNTKSDGTGTVFETGENVKNLTDVDNGKLHLFAQWVYNGGKDIPDNYTKLQYLVADGNQSFDMNIGLSDSDRCTIETCFYPENVIQKSVWGNQEASNRSFNLYLDNNCIYLYCGSNTASTSACKTAATVNTMYTVHGEIDGSQHMINGTVNGVDLPQYNYAGSIGTGNLHLFNNAGQTQFFIGRIYYFRIEKNGVLERDLIPCFDEDDGVAGMYDPISGAFFVSAGTPFIAGPDADENVLTLNRNYLNGGEQIVTTHE